MHGIKSKLFVLALVILAAVGTTLAIRPEERAITIPSVRTKTADDRRASLDALRDAWNNRTLLYSPENEREERAFLNRVASFLRTTHGREVYGDACRFWNQAYHDHASRYSDFLAEN